MNGVYYPLAAAICEIVNAISRATEVRCSPETTPGSVYNLDALHRTATSHTLRFNPTSPSTHLQRNGRLFWATRFGNCPVRVLALHPELITIVARRAIHDISPIWRVSEYCRGPPGQRLESRPGTPSSTGARLVRGSGAADCRHACRRHRGRHALELSLDAVMLVEGHPSEESERPDGQLRPAPSSRRSTGPLSIRLSRPNPI